ncbi:MAG: hypothetical protein ACR2PF_01050 [Rhizobiaceae bacterium]
MGWAGVWSESQTVSLPLERIRPAARARGWELPMAGIGSVAVYGLWRHRPVDALSPPQFTEGPEGGELSGTCCLHHPVAAGEGMRRLANSRARAERDTFGYHINVPRRCPKVSHPRIRHGKLKPKHGKRSRVEDL